MSNQRAEHDEATRLGFWLYILSDIMIFAVLFAVYFVLRHNTAGGPSITEIVDPPYVLLQTLVLLTSSFVCAMAIVAAKYKKFSQVRWYLGMTLLLGASFLTLEIIEFVKLYMAGEGWQVSAFLSSFFVLLATHGLHITIGLIWLVVLMMTMGNKPSSSWLRRLGLFGVFWHFLDIVWIGIFALVYMFGAGGI